MNSAKFFISFIFLVAFAVCATAQKIKTAKKLDSLDLLKMNDQSENLEPGFVTPNELAGYEFFKQGKLNKIRLGVSTKTDIEEIFGSNCEKPCDYDPNWLISFEYFNKGLFLIEENLIKSTEKHYVPKKEVIGKIRSVIISPKKRVSFDSFTFSNEFEKHSYLETGYLRRNDKTDKDDGVLIDVYTDSYGLQYAFFDKFTGDTFKDTFNLRKHFGKFRNGDLISIKYAIPEKLQNIFFIENK